MMPLRRRRFPATAVALLAAVSSGSCAHVHTQPRASSPTVSLDFAAAEAWLAGQKTSPADAERASAATLGGRIAQAAESTFGTDPAPPVPAPAPARVAALLAEMKRWPDVAASVASYLPAPVGGRVRAFVVANGHPWGDAYVRSIRQTDGRITLADDGEPVIVLNVLLIAAQYGDTTREQATSALGVLSHEVFHQLFQRYRQAEPAWRRLESTDSANLQLQMILLDEGVAHFIDRRDELVRSGFPVERSRAALTALSDAVHQLGALPARSAEAERLLHAANEGRYWDKFGSISGMLFSYGVHQAFGMPGLRQAIRCGPGELLRQYDAATRLRPELPKLPGELVAWSSTANLCAAASAR